jgi:hypothetical protein
MDVIAAAFDEESEATSAAHDLESELHLADGLVAVEKVPDPPAGSGGVHPVPGEAVLVAYVEADESAHARDVIGRHHGRHVPLDWLQAIQDEVDPETVPGR